MKYNTESFVDKARLVHGDRYDYSRVKYVDSLSKVFIGCHEHGWFEQVPAEHLRGKGCIKCGQIECGVKQKKKVSDELVERCVKIHGGKYCYDKVVYVNSHHPIIVTCKRHGDFVTRPYRILNGCGCPKCKDETLSSFFSKGRDKFIQDAISVHGDLFDYSLVEYKNNKQPIKIICPIHGVFEQIPEIHLNGFGCPKCGNSGESKIVHFLNKNNIVFKREYYIKNSVFENRQKRLFADFYIPSKSLIIEYNGAQHYKPIKLFGGERKFRKQQDRDKTLELVCEKVGYKLLVIPYTKYKEIDSILSEEFNT